MARRKGLYLEKHPDTGKGGDRGNQHTGGRQTDNLSFSQDTEAKSGIADFAPLGDAAVVNAEIFACSRSDNIPRGLGDVADFAADARKSPNLGVSVNGRPWLDGL